MACAAGKHHLQRCHGKGGHAHIACGQFLGEQALCQGVALLGTCCLQLCNQWLQRRGQPACAGEIGQHAIQHLVPDWVEMVCSGQQRRRKFLRLRNGRCIGLCHTQVLHGAVLGLHQTGDEVQVVGNRVAFSQLADAIGAFQKQAAGIGQQHARKAGVVQRLDLAGLKNALHTGIFSSINADRPGRAIGVFGGPGRGQGLYGQGLA
ncbi:hypothetical protein D3C72_1649120 [compost metagenome]